ncbi:uncharacterized protein EI97DRAFT_315566 [Westerdykella ornata]|uniref:Zn(2)-C6 fungal-type domain-containing protein n=1 Tax=Westerdykella ornata TaxID=318751 RepID=A0A6A6JKU9_WESOR|nr:uncharacterized protein EI97DRAFT_315566 [Westerdykella ornata]KAF2277280.1 hypothetical protein EI97DRAFT_315566 [Westerdykella ornata]
MFHTFQSSVGLRSPGADSDGSSTKPNRATGSRRISTSNACVECRRRKIRCDGTQPCGQCQWYQHPEACGYSKPAQRVIPSRKLVDKLSSNIEQYKSVLSKLYPTKDLDTLANLPREELLELALSTPAVTTSPSTGPTQSISETAIGSDGAESLEALEQAPPEDPYWDEARKHLVRVQGISDDVNGLSMSVDRLSSYVGISSITAALKVIVKCAPHVKPLIAHNTQETALPSRAGSPPPELADPSPSPLPPPAQGQQLIESYFERVHLFFPLIDERKLWSMYLFGDRKDPAWLALLNMVFALGSLASSTADNEAHYVYFNRARQQLSLDSFGSGNLEVLQALAIMSGYYMHYLNRPNEAHSLMGATLRMATALGLHREYSEASRNDPSRHLNITAPGEADSISPEMRRRIWWSLFCMDTWASTTTGRPSLGRMGPSITVLPPGTATSSGTALPQPNTPQYIEQLKTLPLQHASEFCKIATRIQDRLVESPLLTPSETSQYDAEIVRWNEELPSLLSNLNEPCPPFLHRVRLVMKWRFQNIRIVLHRPMLLSTALRRCTFANLTAEEKVAVGKCRIIAAKTIEDISNECLPDLISGWNGVWFTFQACMVPLVSLFSDTSMPEEVEKWKASIETALAFFERSKPWSIAAKRSKDAISKLYQAYKLQFSGQLQPDPAQAQHAYHHSNNGAPVMEGFGYSGVPDVSALSMNNAVWGNDPNSMQQLSGYWDDMMWDTNLPDMLENPFGLGNDYDFQGAAAAHDSGAACWMPGN